MLRDDECSNILKYHQGKKVKLPFMVHVDFETILKKTSMYIRNA